MGVKQYHRHSASVTRSRRWKALRAQILERDGWKCRACGKRGRLEVDHVRPVREHPARAFDPANLQSLCAPCHTRKTRIELGHPPVPESRQKWADHVAALETRAAPKSKDRNDA